MAEVAFHATVEKLVFEWLGSALDFEVSLCFESPEDIQVGAASAWELLGYEFPHFCIVHGGLQSGPWLGTASDGPVSAAYTGSFGSSDSCARHRGRTRVLIDEIRLRV